MLADPPHNRNLTRAPRVRAVTALALVGSLALAGCSSADESTPASGRPEGQGIANVATLDGEWPLTGLPADGPAPRHPVFVVKIDNSAASSPQVGLGRADLVVEELVEGGSTRLAVFYYSRLPERAGPVRSMRATDIGIVQPADAVLVASGGAGPTVSRMAAANVRTVTEGAAGYQRDSSRAAPYNLFVDLRALARRTRSARPPASYLPWGAPGDLPKGRPATRVEAQFSAGHTTRWQFRDGRYVNLDSHAAEGDVFTPDTVLVLRVKVGDAGYLDPAGNPVPETRLAGTGKAMVFHGGEVVRASWAKAGLDDPLRLRTKAGDLRLPPGRVWVELVPADGGGVRFQR